jgi:hypothetical protein
MIVYTDFNKARFGNQLFFVSATIGTALKNNTDYGFLSQMGHSGINYQSIFEKQLPITTTIPQTKYYQTGFGYEEINTQDAELIGYFQSEKFFENYKDVIREQFELKKEITDFVLSKYPSITNSLSIHIRRGDYVGQPNHHPVVPVSYYEKIINEISQNYDFIFVFSDDIQWAKENFKGDKFTFPQFEFNDDLNCFVLMTLAKDNVIGNSTYSWWAAWLNKNQNKKVYTPHYKQWFGPSYSNLDTDDLIPINWIQTEY